MKSHPISTLPVDPGLPKRWASAWPSWRGVLLTTAGLLVGWSLPGLGSEPTAESWVVHCFLRESASDAIAVCAPPAKTVEQSSVASRATSGFSEASAPSRVGFAAPKPQEVASKPTSNIAQAQESSSVQRVEVNPEIIESSPVLRRWLNEVPDIAVDIQHDPAFRTRIRVGYAEFPSANNTGGYYLGVQDLFVGQTPLTLSAEYAANSRGDREIYGADAQFYLLPLGWYGNVAPVLGYRSINNATFNSEGINVGFKIILIPSRTGAADLSFTQSWVAPGTAEEVGLSTFSAGYAIADDIRIGTDIQTQNTRDRQESRVTLLLEWMP